MTKDPSFMFSARTYRPWGQVRRQNLISRVLYVASMMILGLAVLTGLAFLIIFAASVAVFGVLALALTALATFLIRKPARIFVRSREQANSGRGVYEARKKGSTWSVY